MPRRAQQSPMPAFSLGWELEARQGSRTTPAGVVLERDGSVSGQGLEYKISPEYVTRIPESLEALRTLTADPELHVDRSCGFHVHIGLQGRVTPLQRQQWAGNFVLLARSVEESAFQAVPESRRQNNFCRRWNGLNQPIVSRNYSPHKYANAPFRYQRVNVVEMFRPGGIGTVEIRLLGNTKRYAYLLAWIAACHAMARGAWRMIEDPTLLHDESQILTEAFANVRDGLLRPLSNDAAYRVAGVLAIQHCLPAQDITRLISLADASENVRSERVISVSRAHAEALPYQIDLCHQDANAQDHSRTLSQNIEREEQERAAWPAVAVVSSLAGFNPDRFTITPRRS